MPTLQTVEKLCMYILPLQSSTISNSMQLAAEVALFSNGAQQFERRLSEAKLHGVIRHTTF